MHLFGIEERAGGTVAHERVGIPAVPQADNDLGELARAAIALDLGRVRDAAEILRLGFVARGDQVPAAAALADEIERGELARQRERLLIGGLAVQTRPMLRVKPARAAIWVNGSIQAT